MKLEVRPDGLFLDGKKWYLAGGSFHYFRTLPGGWHRRLKLMKAFGLTAVQTYVPWNLHEPEKGTFDFSGRLDLGAFLRACADEGLYVFLRPSPYICGECDLGGLPYWLLNDRDCLFRTTDEPYMTHVREYTERLVREFLPYLSTRGGPVLAVALENEYGSFGMDRAYLRELQRTYESLGVDVPFFTAGGGDGFKQFYGGFPDVWSGLDLGGGAAAAAEQQRKLYPDFPVYISEFWGGRAQQWGGRFMRQSPQAVAAKYAEALDAGAYVNFYMFCGGTNYGFFSGANVGTFRGDVPGARERYIPFTTSYDVDAPVSEAGNATEKYRLCRAVLAKARGMSEDELPPVPADAPVQAAGEIAFTDSRCLFEPAVLDALTARRVTSGNCRTMESLGQGYGWILYATELYAAEDEEYELAIEGLHDVAYVRVDGAFLGKYVRDRDDAPVRFRSTGKPVRIEWLVENAGRVCYGYKMPGERCGIGECVRLEIRRPDGTRMYNKALVTNYVNRTLPMTYESVCRAFAAERSDEVPGVQPRLLRGRFTARAGVDTFFRYDVPGMSSGCVFINGFNVGRYRTVGPQLTLYVPGELLRDGGNEIVVFDVQTAGGMNPFFTDRQELDGLAANAETVLSKS